MMLKATLFVPSGRSVGSLCGYPPWTQRLCHSQGVYHLRQCPLQSTAEEALLEESKVRYDFHDSVYYVVLIAVFEGMN
jgi:hypothetical protein